MIKKSRSEMIGELLTSGLYKKEELCLLQDAILSDLYLRYMITSGKLPIGSVSKPWVINYNPKARIIDVNKSFYQNYLVANENNGDGVAIYSYENGRSIKYDELEQLVNAFADGISDLGVQKGSKVGVIINGCIEEPMCLLSPNKLGASVKYLDYFKDPISIKHDVEKSGLNILFIDEMFLPMEPFINEKHLPVVVLNATKDYSRTNYLTFDDVLRRGSSSSDAVDMQPDDPAIVINSSGTTGTPKPIVHSNKTANTAAQKMLFSGFPLKEGNFTLKAIPSQIGLGSITTLLTSLVSGTGIILIRPETKEQAFEHTIGVLQKYRSIMEKYGLDEESLLMIFASPMFIRSIHDGIENISDMSFIGGILAAGSKMSAKELEEMNRDFNAKGCIVPVNNGYGQNEKGGAAALNTPEHDEPGSAGFPVIGTNIIFVDPKTGEVLTERGRTGRLLENSDSKFIGYEGLPEETKAAEVVLEDGSRWFNTKDLGHMNERGFITITGRESRGITRSDFKISLDAIEEKLRTLDIFKELAVVARFSSDETDEEPILFCVLKDERMTIEDITPLVESVLGIYERPIICLLDKLPILSSGKVDYGQLNERAKTIPSGEDPKSLQLRFSVGNSNHN